MTLSVVQHKSVITEGNSMPITMDSVPTAGNLLIALIYDVVTDLSFTSHTLNTGWNYSYPLAGYTRQWVANTALFGVSFIAYKFVTAEGATITPVTACTNNTPHAMTMFEISNPGQAWDVIYRQQDAIAPFENEGYFLMGGGADVANWTTDASHTTLILMSFCDAGTGTPTVVTNAGAALSTVTTNTTNAWPFSATKTGVIQAFSDNLALNDSRSYGFAARSNPQASVVMVGLFSDYGGGGSSSDIVITTTILEPAASLATFRYTTIAVA